MGDNKITIRKQTSTTIDLDHESLGHGLHVFRRRALTEVSFPGNPDLDTAVLDEDQGIVDDENLALLREGLEAETCGDAYQIMPKAIREELAKKGYAYWRNEGDRGDLISPTHGVYDTFMDGLWSTDDMVREAFVRGQRMLVGLSGEMHPMAISAGADQGFFQGDLYDIDRLHQALSARPDVEMLPPSVHGYGVATNGTPFVHFLWKIEASTLERVLQVTEEMVSDECRQPNFWAGVFECDALGLRAAGATKRDTYYKDGKQEVMRARY